MNGVAPTLEVRKLNVTIPVASGPLRAVRNVDLAVNRGETLCIVGESGCGKSMTSLALMGLLPPRAEPSADYIRFKGEDLTSASEQRMQALRGNRIAMVFQDPMTALNPAYTIGNQLIEGSLGHGVANSRKAAIDRAVAILERCGIGQARRRLGQYPHQLSGGLRQRVMIAMALMTDPDLLIADEPTTALDTTIQAQILELLARLQREFSLAIILITHDFDVVRRFGDRVAVMYAGEIVEAGPTAVVLQNPMHPYTRGLLSCIPSATADGTKRRLGYLAGMVPSLIGEPRGCQFRNRCALAADACKDAVPRHELEGEHSYLCTVAPGAMPALRQTIAPALGHSAAVAARPSSAIELKNVSVTYPVRGGLFAAKAELRALRGVDLDVATGEVVGIVGESGSGKSTLARIVLGLERPTAGRAFLKGTEVHAHDRSSRARLIQPIFQDPYSSLNPRRSVAATIRLPLDIHGIGDGAERDQAVRRMMDLCGLPARVAGSHPPQLSGGQRQRVAIASALVMKPEIVVCDEPTSALDVSVQAQILNLLQDLKSELGLTYLAISHDLDVIRYLADRVCVMYLGVIVEDRPSAELFSSAAHPYTQMLLAAMARGEYAGGKVIGEFPNPLNPPPGCSFHPRCSRASDDCSAVTPALRAFAKGHVACHHA